MSRRARMGETYPAGLGRGETSPAGLVRGNMHWLG